MPDAALSRGQFCWPRGATGRELDATRHAATMRATCQALRWSQPPGRPAGPGRPRSASAGTCPPAAAPASTRQPHPAADAWASPPFCTCPVCGGPLTPATSPTPSLRPPLVCPAGHAYDRGREGHFFLLPTGRKRREAAGPAGDADAQVRARRAFFDGGHFDPIHAAAAGAVCEVLGRRRRREGGSTSRPPFVLDAGCGEGAYARALASHPSRPPATACLGIDVSKPAVRMAASRARGAAGAAAATRFAVASTFSIPLPPGSVDCVLVAMAPAPPAGELARVLVPGSGGLVVVRPGPAHLDGLRRAVYGERARFEGGGEEKEGGVDDGSSSGDHAPLCLLSRARLTFDLALPGPDAAALLGMTPYAWSAGRGLGERLGVEGLETQADLWVEAFGFV